uniref:Uncharacterized protein n=1 Tax=Bosea sp. NBC_00436 TaxID=2969620 RepID=A0A9E8A017_9HYPH
MPTSSDLVKQKRERDSWDAYMAGLRAAEAARAAQPAPVPTPQVETPIAPDDAPDGLSNG